MEMLKKLLLAIFLVFALAASANAFSSFPHYTNYREDMTASFANSDTAVHFDINASFGNGADLLMSPLGNTSGYQTQYVITQQGGIIYIFDRTMNEVTSLIAGTPVSRLSVSNWDSNFHNLYIFGIYRSGTHDFFKVFGYNNTNDQLYLERSIQIEGNVSTLNQQYTDIGCSSAFTSGTANDLTTSPLCIFGYKNQTYGFNFSSTNGTTGNFFNHQYAQTATTINFGAENGHNEIKFGNWLGVPSMIMEAETGFAVINYTGSATMNRLNTSANFGDADFDKPLDTSSSGRIVHDFQSGTSMNVEGISQAGSTIWQKSFTCTTGALCSSTLAMLELNTDSGNHKEAVVEYYDFSNPTTTHHAKAYNTADGSSVASMGFLSFPVTADFARASASGLFRFNNIFIFKTATTDSTVGAGIGFLFNNGLYDWNGQLIINITPSNFVDRSIASPLDTSTHFSIIGSTTGFTGIIASTAVNEPPHIVNTYVSIPNPVCVNSTMNVTVDYTDAENEQIQLDLFCDGTTATETGFTGFSYSPVQSCTFTSVGNFNMKIYITDPPRANQLTSSTTRPIQVASTNCYNASNSGVFAQNTFGQLGQNTSAGFDEFGINSSLQSQGNATSNYHSQYFDTSVCNGMISLLKGLCPFWYWLKVLGAKALEFILISFGVVAGILLLVLGIKFIFMRMHKE